MNTTPTTDLNTPIIVTNWYDENLNDEVARRFDHRRHLLDEMIEQDTAAAHSGTLLTDILADDYNGDRDAMAADIGTGAFDSHDVVDADRAEWDEAVAATRFKKGDEGWQAVGPLGTAGQAMDGKEAFIDITRRNGDVAKMILIANSRRYYNEDGVQFYIADIVR